MRINHNITALNTYNKLSANQATTAKSLEKLSSGLKINRAGDNAAGLAISEKMRGQIRGLDQASANASDGISLIKTAEGGLNETHAILQRMRELAVQGASDTNETIDRAAIKTELDQLTEEITRIGNTTEFNDKKLLNGSLNSSIINVGTGIGPDAGISKISSNGASAANDYTLAYDDTTNELTVSSLALGKSSTLTITPPTVGSMETQDVNFSELGITVTVNEAIDAAAIAATNTFEVAAGGSISVMIGANEGQNITIDIKDMRALVGGELEDLSTIDVSTASNAEAAVTVINTAINTVSGERSKLGAFQNRLEHTINNLGTASENTSSAESRIRDVDMAKEMMEFTKSNILAQAAQSMLAQANQQPQGVLQLLQ